ncbi:hypothetical protein [Nocardia nepalensis]|uniref:hypothetical protein n=1 Tax=Nocardia nepalensis TaxID=3375448 RepID=UPI003B678EA4
MRDSVSGMVEEMRDAGFAVVRLKLEVVPWAEGVPETGTAAAELGEGYYFEHHVKLVLDAEEELARLSAIAAGHQAHLSANARRARKLLGRTECSLNQAADLVTEMRRGLARMPDDYRGLGDPHRIATALAPYV